MPWAEIHRVRIYGDPKSQPRPHSRRHGQGVYPPGAKDWKTAVREAFRDEVRGEPLDEPLKIDIDFYLSRPKTFNKRTRNIYGVKPSKMPKGRLLHTGKPERGNLDKAVLDALSENGLGLFRDDALVCAGEIWKFYHADGERPGAEVVISVHRHGP